MFRRWLNRATVQVAISPRGPVLVKSGQQSADPTRPGMEFVRTRHASLVETVYLPGTSLKGAMRSHAERVLLGLGIHACNPLVANCGKPQRSADGRKPPRRSSAEIFASQCAACQTFGSLSVAGRCNVEDAYPRSAGGNHSRGSPSTSEVEAANATETRWQVGISRLTGQAQGTALFDLEVVVGGAFRTTIHLENFGLWQLGLIGALLADIDQGDVAIGFGKSRGLGQVSVAVEEVHVEMLGREGDRLAGAGSLCSAQEARSYGLVEDDTLPLPDGLAFASTWRGRKLSATDGAARDLLAALADRSLGSWVKSPSASSGKHP